MSDFARATIDLIDLFLQKRDPESARQTIEGTAKRIAGHPGYEDTVALFERALEQPIDKAADFIRERLSARLTLRVEVPGEG